MPKYSIYSFLLLILGCGGKYSEPIYIPEPNQEYYVRSIDVLEEELKEQPRNLELIELQLSYYQYIGWPERAAESIERGKRFISVSEEIRNYLKAYYLLNNKYEGLLSYLEDLNRLGVLSQKEQILKVKTLTRLGRNVEALEVIEELSSEVKKSFHFELAQAYFALENEPLAMLYFYRSYREGVTNPVFVTRYVPLLVAYGHETLAEEILRQYPDSQADSSVRMLTAQVLYSNGNRDSAQRIMKEIGSDRAYFMLAQWYSTSNRADSAVYFLEEITKRDTSNIAAYIEMGDINNRRNYLAAALKNYQRAEEIDKNNEYVASQLAIVRRKIAYLRKSREQKEEIPTLNLDSKNVEN